MFDRATQTQSSPQPQQVLASQQAPAASPAAPPDDAVEVVPLPEVLRQIGRDSRKDALQYLDETSVPLGGE